MTMSLEEAARALVECRRVDEEIGGEIARLTSEREANRARLDEACRVLGVKVDRACESGARTLCERVGELLDRDPTCVFTTRLVANNLNISCQQANTAVVHLIGKGRAERVSHGHYRSTRKIPKEDRAEGDQEGGGSPSARG